MATLLKKTIGEIARGLLEKASPGTDVAFLIEKNSALYFAYHSEDDHAPTSAVLRLIQGIYATEPERSRVLVRNRIYTTSSLKTMCRGIIQVAAKRATDKILDEKTEQEVLEVPTSMIDLTVTENGLLAELSYENKNPPIQSATDDLSWMNLANQLTLSTQEARERESRLFLSNRPVAAILVSKTGELLDWAINTNAVNKTLHAEINLVQSYYRKFKSKLPAGSKVFTTLKPCKMCAAMMVDAAEDMRNFEVIYDEDDPGPNARNTALEKFQRKLVR